MTEDKTMRNDPCTLREVMLEWLAALALGA